MKFQRSGEVGPTFLYEIHRTSIGSDNYTLGGMHGSMENFMGASVDFRKTFLA